MAQREGRMMPIAELAISPSAEDGPMLVSAASVRTHGAVGDFAIPLPLAAGASAGVECRAGGPTRIVLQFTEAVTLSGCGNVDLSSGTCDDVNDLGGNVYQVELSGADENACLTLTLVNVAGVSSGQRLVGINQVRVVVLKGDVDASPKTSERGCVLGVTGGRNWRRERSLCRPSLGSSPHFCLVHYS